MWNWLHMCSLCFFCVNYLREDTGGPWWPLQQGGKWCRSLRGGWLAACLQIGAIYLLYLWLFWGWPFQVHFSHFFKEDIHKFLIQRGHRGMLSSMAASGQGGQKSTQALDQCQLIEIFQFIASLAQRVLIYRSSQNRQSVFSIAASAWIWPRRSTYSLCKSGNSMGPHMRHPRKKGFQDSIAAGLPTLERHWLLQ